MNRCVPCAAVARVKPVSMVRNWPRRWITLITPIMITAMIMTMTMTMIISTPTSIPIATTMARAWNIVTPIRTAIVMTTIML